MSVEGRGAKVLYSWKNRWEGEPCRCDTKYHEVTSSGFDTHTGGRTDYLCANCGHTWSFITYWDDGSEEDE